jgi:hypothetical protein
MRSRRKGLAARAVVYMAGVAAINLGAATASPTVHITKIVSAGVAGPTFVVGSISPSWTLNNIDSLAVNNAGHWYVEVGAGGTPNRAGAVVNLGAGNVTLAEHWAAGYFTNVCNGDAAGWAERGLHLVSMNNNDHFIRNMRFTNYVVTATPGNDQTGNVSALMFDNKCVLTGGGFLAEPAPTTLNPAGVVGAGILGDAIGAPASASFTPGSIWGRPSYDTTVPPRPTPWNDDCILRMNDSNVVLICAQFSDTPGIPSTIARQAVCRLNLSATGALTSTDYIAKTGDAVPSPGLGLISSIAGSPGTAASASIQRIAINNSNVAIFSVATDFTTSYLVMASAGSPATLTILASSGDQSPVAGLNYGSLDGVPCDINDNGDWAMRAPLSDGSAVVVKSIGGVVSAVAHVGDSLPDIAPSTLLEVGKINSTIKIDSAGRVMWWGRFNATASNCAYFRDQEVLVRQGVTTRLDSTVIGTTAATDGTTTTQNALDFDADNFEMSRDGHWAIFKVNGTGTAQSANLMEIVSGGVCCRGATCSTAFASAAACESSMNTTSPATIHSAFVSAASVCNEPAVPPATLGNTRTPCCYANYNHNATLEVQDIFDFLNDWFAGKLIAIPGGDGASGALAVQNIFDFLNAWFAGGCA